MKDFLFKRIGLNTWSQLEGKIAGFADRVNNETRCTPSHGIFTCY